jgi:hypothetical protein
MLLASAIGSVDGWMGGWVEEWMGGWVDGWMRQVKTAVNQQR